ncbi:hypothetical protein Tco_0260457 [Tanacetum coccineum]
MLRKTPLQLINEDEPTQPQPEPEPEHHGKGDEYDVERAIQMSLESFQAQSQAHVGGVAIREPVRRTPATEEASTGPFVQPQDNASANIVRDSSSPADAETFTDTDKINSGDGPDPGESRVALSGPNSEPTHDEFMANVYPNVQESLKFPADEHVILEDPLSSTGTLS